MCKSLGIPTPGLGYWAKVRAGKPIKRTHLPKSDKPDTKSGVRANLELQVVTESLQFLSSEDKSIVLSVASQIPIPDKNARMHPKIIAHQKKVVEWYKESCKQDRYQNRKKVESQPFLAGTISEAALPRVCYIFDTLIKALEPLGCSLTDDLSFVIKSETVSISISESKDKVTHVPTREENIRLMEYEEKKRRNTWASKPNIRKYDYIYNGKLSIVIDSEKSFRDCNSYVLEDRLGDILILLYEASNKVRLRREEKEAEELKRQEEARLREERRERYNLEVERTNALANAAEDFDIACKIRAYISAVERKDEFLGSRDHSENSDRKKLEKSYSSWGW